MQTVSSACVVATSKPSILPRRLPAMAIVPERLVIGLVPEQRIIWACDRLNMIHVARCLGAAVGAALGAALAERVLTQEPEAVTLPTVSIPAGGAVRARRLARGGRDRAVGFRTIGHLPPPRRRRLDTDMQ